MVRRIQEEILAGRLRPGDRLPGERQLSEVLQVSRPSVREAVRVLQALEIVRSRPGTGPDSGLIVSTEPVRALSDLLRLHVALTSYSVADVLQVRMSLEDQAVRLLAASEDVDTTRLRELLAEMSVPGLDPDTFHQLDTDFHLELARATGNDLLADLMQALREAVRQTMLDAFLAHPDWDSWVDELVDEHRAIFAAVSDGDGETAARLIREHIGGFYAALQYGAEASR
ncbi:MAG: FCD domain-containing protein [Streptosporangiales bacterium]|nr:FCD domain-containing protein [Streptosporangiales bacterium]